jgi:hypothetical protein
MTQLWRRLLDRLLSPPPAAPAPPFAAREVVALPRTSVAAARNDGAERPRVFDPALRQFGSALRPGDPVFDDAETARRWTTVRRRATDHVLRAIAESAWGDSLVLRGSRLLAAWAGDFAREPGDLDWVVDPPTRGSTDGWSEQMFTGLPIAVLTRPTPEGLWFFGGEVAQDEIWTYERSPGRRFVFPWQADGLPGGAVQVDVAFGQEMVEPSQRQLLPAADGGCVSVRVASPAQSLAWKLQWLTTDNYPQGKDLYDAVLLAERFRLPVAVLERTLRLAGVTTMLTGTAEHFVSQWGRVDWENFQAEVPWVDGERDAWEARLIRALGPTFAEQFGEPVSAGEPALDPAWLTPMAVAVAAKIDAERAFDGLPMLADALEEAGCQDRTLLDHCRSGGPHPRGCWVVEQVLGRR